MSRNRIRSMFATAFTLLGIASACGHSTDEKTPPARVSNRVAEADLTEVTLTEQAERRLGIATAAVERRAHGDTRTLGGVTLAPPGGRLVITAPFAATVLAPGAAEVPQVGARLEPGRGVFRLIPLLAGQGDLGVESTRELSAAQTRFQVTSERAARAEQLLEVRAGSARALEEATAELKVARADLEAARARASRVAGMPVELDGGLVLLAPRSSVLQDVFVSEGQSVAAGTPLFELVSHDPLWVRVPIYVGGLSAIDGAKPAWVRALGSPPDSPAVEARPVSEPVTADPASATGDLLFELPNAKSALRAGQRVNVTVGIAGAAERLVVPASAVLYDIHGGTWVYRADEPRIYRRQRVAVASVTNGLAVLARGPEPGTRVVTDGAAELFGTEFGAGK